MQLVDAAVFAALQGFTTVLPLSASGHQVAARIWLGTGRGLDALEALAQLGCLAAIVLAVRHRLGRACLEGIRGIARPAVLQTSAGGRDALALVVAALVAAGTELALRPLVGPLNEMPFVAGTAMLSTGVAIASTALAPAPQHVAPGAAGALLVGLAHGLAIVPGCSRIGAAFVVLRWLGVAQWRAAELALMVSVPVMALGGARLLLEHPDFSALDASQMTLAMLLSFVAAALGASWFKALCERHRAAALSLWLVPLSLAILAYSRALPDPMEAIPAPPPSGMHSSAERERRASWLTPTL